MSSEAGSSRSDQDLPDKYDGRTPLISEVPDTRARSATFFGAQALFAEQVRYPCASNSSLRAATPVEDENSGVAVRWEGVQASNAEHRGTGYLSQETS